MIRFEVDGRKLELRYLLLDYTGTLSENGRLISGVRERLKQLSRKFESVKVLTADTFGTARRELEGLDVEIHVIEGTAKQFKGELVNRLGPQWCVAIGNGNNDTEMLRQACIGIAVINADGCFTKAILSADIVAKSIEDALDMLFEPRKLIADLRE